MEGLKEFIEECCADKQNELYQLFNDAHYIRRAGTEYAIIDKNNEVKISTVSTTLNRVKNIKYAIAFLELSYVVVTQTDRTYILIVIDENENISDSININGWTLGLEGPHWGNRAYYYTYFIKKEDIYFFIQVKYKEVASSFPKIWEYFLKVSECETKEEADKVMKIEL